MNSQEVDAKQHGASADLPDWVANIIKKWKAHGDRQSADTQYRIYQMCGELRAACKASEPQPCQTHQFIQATHGGTACVCFRCGKQAAK